MNKLLALMAVLALGIANNVAFMWYGYGVWPQSWFAIIACGLFATTVLRLLYDAVTKREE